MVERVSASSLAGQCLTLLHSERPKLYAILAFLSAVDLIKLLGLKPPTFGLGFQALQLLANINTFKTVNSLGVAVTLDLYF